MAMARGVTRHPSVAGALYINAREVVAIRNILNEIGHKQPPTPIQTDNSTAEGIINKIW